VPGVDRFGVEMLYPTKAAGQEWYMNMVNPTSDGRFNPQDQITRNPDGSWKMKSDKVRMYVYTSNGYNTHQLTSDSGQSKVAARGFMGSPVDWRDVEITGYVKLNEFTENDNFVWYTRGGKHTDSDQCQGSGYKGNLFYHGETQFSKEQWHVSYAKSPTITATSPLEGKWIGFKFVMFNFVNNDGKPAVKLENWINTNADGKNWVKVYEGGDSGKWGRSGAECQVRADQILTWGGPIAAFRWDFAQDVDFRDLSVREITGENVTIQGIHYFTGTSTSSNVPNFGNSIATGADGENILLGEPVGNKFASDNLVNRSQGPNPVPSPTSNNRNNEASGESSNQQQVSSGTNVYVLWVRGDEDNTDLYLKISHDGGATFGPTIDLSNNPASLSYNPKIVASGQNVYIVWEDDEGNSGNSDIFFVKSSDAGKTFTGKSNLSNDPSGSGTPQLSVFDGNVYVAWTGTSPDSTDIFLAQSSNDGNSFSGPENLSNDPDISFNPVLSVNGTHVYVEWTDQDDSGITTTKSKALPNIMYKADGIAPSNADLSAALNSNYSSPDILPGQNSTYAYGNESKTETQAELNQTAVTSNLDASSSGSNSSSSFIPKTEPSYTTTTNGSTLDNQTDTKNINSDDLSPSIGKLVANKIRAEVYSKTNWTLDDQVKRNGLSEVDAGADPENMTAQGLAALTAAEEALKAKENVNLERNTISSENALLTSTMEEEIETIQPSHNKEQHKQSEPITGAQLDTTPASELFYSQEKQVSPTQPGPVENVKGSQLEVIQEERKPQQQQQVDTEQSQKEAQQQRPKEKALPVKDKTVDTSPTPDSHIGNELSSRSSDRTHTEDVERKKITNLKIQKIEDQKKIMNQKKFINSENAKEQRQKNEARHLVQSLIRQADEALNNAQGLIKQSKLANQKAQDAVEEDKSRQKETQQHQEENNELISQELSQLINEAKTSDQKAQVAVEKYNDLRRAAETAVEEFNTRFG